MDSDVEAYERFGENNEETIQDNSEFRSELKECGEKCNTITVSDNRNTILEQLLKTCSSFSKLRRALAYVLRFIQILRERVKETHPISVTELKTPKNLLFKWCQQEINAKKTGDPKTDTEIR